MLAYLNITTATIYKAIYTNIFLHIATYKLHLNIKFFHLHATYIAYANYIHSESIDIMRKQSFV